MQTVIHEDGVELIPESDHEEEALRKIKRKSIKSIDFEDAWNETGSLKLTHGKHPWDLPGGR